MIEKINSTNIIIELTLTSVWKCVWWNEINVDRSLRFICSVFDATVTKGSTKEKWMEYVFHLLFSMNRKSTSTSESESESASKSASEWTCVCACVHYCKCLCIHAACVAVMYDRRFAQRISLDFSKHRSMYIRTTFYRVWQPRATM